MKLSNPHPLSESTDVIRRSRDIALAVVALVVLLVPMIVIAVVVKATSPGPALFRQERVGQRRTVFTFYKFRTMTVGSDDSAHRDLISRELRGETALCNGSSKLSGDSRITPIGRWLRATSLDEVPQLINVLRGQMSLIGPRPCLPWEADMFPAEYEDRFRVRPGLTGLWQVSGRSRLGTIDMLRLDVRYVRERTHRLDCLILLMTLPALVRGGAR